MNLIEEYIKNNHFGRLIGMDFQIIGDGIIDYHLKVDERHLATPGAAHGGVISALVDGALGVAGLSAVHMDAKVVSTVEYKINYLAPAFLGDHLQAKAKVESKGKRLMVISCDVFCTNRENKLVAKAIGTFNAYAAGKAGYQVK